MTGGEGQSTMKPHKKWGREASSVQRRGNSRQELWVKRAKRRGDLTLMLFLRTEKRDSPIKLNEGSKNPGN